MPLYAGGSEAKTLAYRFGGHDAWSYWGAVVLNFVPLQALWWRRVRMNPLWLFLIGLSSAIGMWLERYMLVMSTLARGWLTSSAIPYYPTFWDWGVYLGTLGLFLTLFLLFVRFLPVISAFEVKEAAVEDTHD